MTTGVKPHRQRGIDGLMTDQILRKPSLAIFGDTGEQKITKTIWSLLAGRDLRIMGIDNFSTLDLQAPDMAMILFVIDGLDDPHIEMARLLSRNPLIVCNIVAITRAMDTNARVHVYANGFDAIVDIEVMDHKDLKPILINMLDKGVRRLENRVSKEEYGRFQASLSASPDAFIIIDENSRIFFVSEHYLRAYPINGHLLKRGQSIIDLYDILSGEHGVLPGDPRYAQLRHFWQNPRGQEDITFDNGRTWRIKATALEGGMGTIITTTDISEYQTRQDVLAEKSSALEHALEMEQESAAIQKQFINMVSHEFRTPMSIIDGNAQILLRRFETLTPEIIRQRLNTIRSATSRLVAMMEGVLSSNMLRTGRMEITPETFDLRTLMQEMCGEYADLSSSHVIECWTDNLPDNVFLDKKAITLILSNLIGNAVKFSREDPLVQVEGFVTDSQVILAVRDNGVGIPQNELDKVCERYYRATTAGGIPGTGIGLNLVQELLTLCGGEISIESAIGQGTYIEARFPRTADPALSDTAPGVPSHAHAQT